jgi:hypothetical protein
MGAFHCHFWDQGEFCVMPDCLSAVFAVFLPRSRFFSSIATAEQIFARVNR